MKGVIPQSRSAPNPARKVPEPRPAPDQAGKPAHRNMGVGGVVSIVTHLSAEFHLQAILEMLRVSREVRVFPFRTLEGMLLPHLPIVRERLTQDGYSVEVECVPRNNTLNKD